VNWRAFGAVARREVQRGRQGLWVHGLAGAAALIASCILSAKTAGIIGAFCIIPAFLIIFWPIGNLRTDKTQGFIEFDRVLPISHRALATARLAGAALRTSPLLLLAAPLIISFYREHRFGAGTLTILLAVVPLGSWLVMSVVMWLIMAVNIRWNLRRLWWVPMTIGFAPSILQSVLPPPWKRAIEDALTSFFDRNGPAMLDFLGSAAGLASVALILGALVIGMLFGTVSLFASGIDRYTYDASGAVEMRAKPPKRELAAIGRGPALAVARYCIRLATEQSWRRLILLALFVVVLLFGQAELKRYAQTYVRVLAAMIPGGIALQLSVARTRGYLEGIQQLPHSAMTIGAGYLLGIAVLATPGVAVWVLARAVTGTPPTVTNVLSLWGWMVGWSWVACVTMVWLTARRIVMIAAGPVVLIAGWATYIGWSAFTVRLAAAANWYATLRTSSGALLPLVVAVLMMVGGLPLFARGLAEFEFGAAKKVPFWRRFTNPRTASA
jgi:hypothetical protein